ncbi:MAG TPA: hypothetical protein VFE79_14880 [Paraburkholderia sp.]|jgi:hypothetical protein|nr:hypothetical protein [Paraburkholderia sp.]
MNKPSERIVVFVTTAQKRAITSTAENLGISVSELMRRAVLSFGATSEQVKAASIVDRLRAPREPDALNAALQRVARGTRHARAIELPVLQTREDSERAAARASADASSAADRATSPAPAARETVSAPAKNPLPRTLASADATSMLPAGVLAALSAAADEEAIAAAEAVARVAAAKAAAVAQTASGQNDTDAQLRSVIKRPRVDTSRNEDDPQGDPSTEGGRFA